ncbi:MAG TPA: NAD-glutamate dehydrogenase [Solirubrobacteraceae bacterium]|nr:NAD-glutamate dehydrogenase [Solirubrobacteraceae bacterium]
MSTTEESEQPELERLLALVDERVPPEQAGALREFAKAYVRRIGAAGPVAKPEPLFHEIAGAFALAGSRDGAPAAVRAFNPSAERDGYTASGSVVETNTDDLPFLVDSVSAALQGRGLRIVRVQHPIVGTERDPRGAIERVVHPGEGARSESVMHFELDRRLEPEELAELEDAVREVLGDVRRVVRDFPKLQSAVARMADLAEQGDARYSREEIDEGVQFLLWLREEHFIFLGYREYALREGTVQAVAGSGLGLLDDDRSSGFADPVALDDLPPGVRGRFLEGDLLTVTKTNRPSPVHRRERMDYVSVRVVGDDGAITGEARMLGLFTTRAYTEPAAGTPVLQRKLRALLAAEDLIEGSHDYKAAVALFESFPKDELFSAPVEDLRRAVVALLGLPAGTLRLFGRRHADGRAVSLILAVPKDRYDAALLVRVRELLLRRFGADAVDEHEVLGEGEEAVRVHFAVRGPTEDPSFADLERDVAELARTWDDRARERLVEEHGEERGRMLAARWAPRFPESYKAAVRPDAAARDIACFERLFGSGEAFLAGLRNEQSGGRTLTRIGLYRVGGKVELSRAMPMLEHLGLRVIEERPTRLLGGAAGGEAWLQDFGVLGPGDAPLDLDECAERVADCIGAVWRGEAESDTLNRLVVSAGLDWRRVGTLRAYRRYRQRIGSRFTEGYQNDVITQNPGITAKLMRLFELRFDPASERDEAAEGELHDAILADLEDVVSLDHDRILRNQLGLIDATVRTNAYRAGRRALAFKLRSAEVPAIPQPSPLFEIYVYSPVVEGIHLRGGRIARGGIRWSDRMDYRTEVFGLMRAQMTKNAVIVPDGAKGGFYLKRPPEDREQLREEVERQYVTYISGLLDLTDNLVDGEVVHPDCVRVLDEDDTYLVVAADKGTATFSDTANRVAARYGFWLGDAFASGGSHGYDHKGLGITARGAWESLKRHFRELGMDPAQDEFTAVGIGDMSGDVFGNGMLLSERIRLVAAYDHRHVFIDPAPDAARSFTERRRLFELAGSSWDDYDRALISEGGGVWPRTAKSIALSEQARAALGIEDEKLAPADVIRAVLRAPVDVLWNGGIGTVVKASTESDDDAHDRSSDALRVDARDLRCRVVVEGGNLGLTHRARIEYARGGGHVNADFIDNSAGVDCSDHEVNLKVLLDLAVRRGELDEEGRNALLREVTEDVAAHVLYDSFLQAQLLAQEVRGSAGRIFAYEDLMTALEARGLLDRAVEALPSTEEMAERRRGGQGMERPELAVLLAYAKRALTGAVLDSELPEDPYLEGDLRSYFPPPVVERFGGLLAEHPLRRELIATLLSNDLVNSLGPTFASRLVAEQGVEPAEVVRAFRIARVVTGALERWEAIEDLGTSVEPALQWQLMEGVDWLVEITTRWYLAHAPGGGMGPAVDAAREGFALLDARLAEMAPREWRERRDEQVAELTAKGVPEQLARAHAYQAALVHAPDVIAVAGGAGHSVEEVGRVFELLGGRLRIGWLEQQIEELPTGTRMQRWAQQALRDDVLRARRELAERALAEAGAGDDVEGVVDAFLARRERACERQAAFSRRLAGDGGADLAGLTLAVRGLRSLVGSD